MHTYIHAYTYIHTHIDTHTRTVIHAGRAVATDTCMRTLQCKEYGWTCNEALLADEALIVMSSPYFYTKLNAALGGNMTIAYWKPWSLLNPKLEP